MAVSDQIERIKTNIANAYTTAETMGATMPEVQNSENLSTTIGTIPSGGGGESTTEQYGIIFDEVNDSGIPTKITYNLGLLSQVPGFTVNTLAQVTHLRFKGEAIRRIQALQREVVAGLKLLIIPASVRTLVLDLWAFEQPTMYMVFEGDVPPTVSVNGEATCEIIVVHPDNANPEDWSDLIASVSTSNSGVTYSDFVNDILGGVDPWDSVIYE